jgi:hypothetical protein
MNLLLAGPFVLMATCSLATALRVLVTRKPFVFAARWLFWMMALIACWSCAVSVRVFGPAWGTPHTWLLALQPVMFGAMLFSMWHQMSGYMALGVDGDALRDGLLVVLRRLDIEFAESLSQIELPQLEAKLLVAISSGMGWGQIKIKPAAQRALLKRIARELVDYLWASKAKPAYVGLVPLLASGIFAAAAAVIFGCFVRFPF